MAEEVMDQDDQGSVSAVESVTEQLENEQLESEQLENPPSSKRMRLDSLTTQDHSEVTPSSEGTVLNHHSPSSQVDEPEYRQSFILTNYLPKNVAKPSLQKPDELEKKLIECLKPRLEKEHFSSHLEQLSLTLPEKYSSSLENNTHLFCNLVQISTGMLASTDAEGASGVKTVKEVVLPCLDIQQLPTLLSELKIDHDMQLELIEVPFRAQSKEQLLNHLPKAIVCLCKHFSASQINLCDPSKTQPELKLSDSEKKEIQKRLKPNFSSPDEPAIMYGKNKLFGKPKKKEASGNKTPARVKDKGAKPSAKATDKKSGVLLTFDSRTLSLEVSDRITAYNYWDLKAIHGQHKYTGEGTVVAVIDTGVESSHPAFSPICAKIIASRNFAERALDCTTDQHGHGTACAGIACGKGFLAYKNPDRDDSVQVSVPPGVAPDAKLVVCKVTRGSDGIALPEATVRALKHIKEHHTAVNAADRVDVVSLSFGSNAYSEPIARAITDLVNVGVIVVCAACNDGHKFHTPICYPARLGHVLCIGSHGAHGKASLFSPVGQELDFLAPGEHIVAPGMLEYQGEAESGDGTSYATPAVAGLICLILQCLKRKFGQQKAEKFHNHWVMKELLREISTNGGTHSNDRGFGALAPIRFFRQPERYVKSIEMDILNSGQ